MPNWTIPFFIHPGVWKANSLGVCQKHFLRESGTKIVFTRGSEQVFQRGHTGWGLPGNVLRKGHT